MIKIENMSIKSELSEIGRHISSIIHMTLSQLKNGILNAAPFSFSNRSSAFQKLIDTQYNSYISNIKSLSKEEIILLAEEITYILNISSILRTSSAEGIGLIANKPDLLTDIYDSTENDENADFSKEYISSAIEKYIAENTKDKRHIEKCIKPFMKEAEQSIDEKASFSVTLSETGETNASVTFLMTDFYDYLEPEILSKFSERYMTDFPCPSYFGTDYSEIYFKLRKLRFCGKFVRNFKTFQVVGKNNGIIKLSRQNKEYSENFKAEIQNRYIFAQFVQRNYSEPETVLESMLKHNDEASKALEEFNKLLGGGKT